MKIEGMRILGTLGLVLVLATVAPLWIWTGGGRAAQVALHPGSAGSVVNAISLDPRAIVLDNPTSPGARPFAGQRVAVHVSLLDPAGNAITSGALANPIAITIHGPAHRVLTTSTTPISSAVSTITFTYSGEYFVNPMVATAVSGHIWASVVFVPKHRGLASTKAVTFAMTGQNNVKHGWHFSASVGGGPPHTVQMDTGSVGVVVPAQVLGPTAIGPGAAGKIEYSSSGKIFLGHYYLASITLRVGKVSVTTVPMQVLAVQSAACDPKHPKCRPGKASGVGMLGVGFGRARAPAPSTLHNAFLALADVVNGSMHPGYIVRAHSVTLGLTAAGEAGFRQIPLKPNAAAPDDWSTEPGCFGFPNLPGYTSICGTMLVDTGLGSMILALPASKRPPGMDVGARVPAGAQIRVAAPSSPGSAISYSFTSGDGGPATPREVRWARGVSPFVNTSRALIGRFDYLYDAALGRVGFKPSSAP